MKKEGKKCNRNLRNKMRANYHKAVGCAVLISSKAIERKRIEWAAMKMSQSSPEKC